VWVLGVVGFTVRIEVCFVGRFELLDVGRCRDCARGGDVMRRVSCCVWVRTRGHHVLHEEQAQARKGMSKALLGFDKNNGFWTDDRQGVGVIRGSRFL
jgi:hypothetical protein